MKKYLLSFGLFFCIYNLVAQNATIQKNSHNNNYDSISLKKLPDYDSVIKIEKCITGRLCTSNCSYLYKKFGKRKVDEFLKLDGNSREVERRLLLVTQDKKTLITVMEFPGIGLGQFYVVSPNTYRLNLKEALLLPFNKIKTNMGTELGASEKNVLKRIGMNYYRKQIYSGIVTYTFKWRNSDDSTPQYTIFYAFKNHKLIKFGFGMAFRESFAFVDRKVLQDIVYTPSLR
jgi:hypothetical protein